MPSKPTVHEILVPFVVAGEKYLTYCKVVGDLTDRTKTPIVVLHGGPGFSHDYLIPICDLALSTYSSNPVIFYDQLGQCRSTHLKDKPASFWSVDLFIDELENLLVHFDIQNNFHILGHSWGGMLALDFEIRRQPAGLKTLVISDSLAAMSLWGESNAKLEAKFPKDVQEGLSYGFNNDATRAKFREASAKYNAVHGCTVAPFPEELTFSLGQLYNDDGDRTVTNAMFGGELKNWDVRGKLGSVRVPTLIINGKEDMAQDFVVEPLYREIKEAGRAEVKWVTMPNSSHCPMWEERQDYMKLVDDFISEKSA